ncbi:DMT family transporter [uncultured Anaerococcus sp.]|uniref:DMT family transporter n=1 Tax=uncultured Anaerococcus sp. TaxID=293428 RepID=UPI00288B0E55|nr:DMT family transporter [uncultured Anaerococcus sp.]
MLEKNNIVNRESKLWPILLALLAAIFYAISTPFSKVLLDNVGPTFMAGFLYLGAGLGVGIIYLFHYKDENKNTRLGREDLPYSLGMIVLDIVAPIFLMLGIEYGTASNASLLGNFEIVATTLIALFIFKEKVSARLWIAIGFISSSCILLSFEGADSFKFSIGSIFVILATSSWGLENNCTRKIADKSTYQIVLLKGIFSGGGSLLIGLFIGEKFPPIKYIIFVMLLGFVAYGLSIFLYIRAQRDLGAAKTSAYYAVAPFIGALLSFLINGEKLTPMYFIGLSLMIVGTIFVVKDTMAKHHNHTHNHLIVHFHNGRIHTHKISHAHDHEHFIKNGRHRHEHRDFLLSKEHILDHN